MSDEFDASTLLEVDNSLSFRRPGIGPDVTAKLRKGEWAIQKQIDLHGLRRDDARETLSAFIRDCHKQGLRCVRVVHGKGLGSPGKTPVLKFGCKAGWCRRMKCWPTCRLVRWKAALVRCWCCWPGIEPSQQQRRWPPPRLRHLRWRIQSAVLKNDSSSRTRKA